MAQKSEITEKRVKDPVSVMICLYRKWEFIGRVWRNSTCMRWFMKISRSTSQKMSNSMQKNLIITPSSSWNIKTRAEPSTESTSKISSMMTSIKLISHQKSMINLKLSLRFLKINGQSHRLPTSNSGGTSMYCYYLFRKQSKMVNLFTRDRAAHKLIMQMAIIPWSMCLCLAIINKNDDSQPYLTSSININSITWH